MNPYKIEKYVTYDNSIFLTLQTHSVFRTERSKLIHETNTSAERIY